jgi:hypothetical protein
MTRFFVDDLFGLAQINRCSSPAFRSIVLKNQTTLTWIMRKRERRERKEREREREKTKGKTLKRESCSIGGESR